MTKRKKIKNKLRFASPEQTNYPRGKVLCILGPTLSGLLPIETTHVVREPYWNRARIIFW